MIEHFMKSGKVAAFVCVQPKQSFHMVTLGEDESHTVTSIQELSRSGLYVNGGYFILRKEIFDYMHEGEELVEEPFRRLVSEGLLAGYRHDGFWLPMDTFKDKQLLEDMYSRGEAPWEVWKRNGKANGKAEPLRQKATFAWEPWHQERVL
jgi:glucose-1-phosphate cytidylyltransferase